MFALVKEGQVIKTTTEDNFSWNGTDWKDIRTVAPEMRKAHGIFDFVPCQSITPAFGFHHGGVSIAVDQQAGIVTEVQNPDIAMDAAALAEATKVKLDADILTLENSITDRMWREDALSSTAKFPIAHPTWPDMTATQAIAQVNTAINNLRK